MPDAVISAADHFGQDSGPVSAASHFSESPVKSSPISRLTGSLYEGLGLPANPAEWPSDFVEGVKQFIKDPAGTTKLILSSQGSGVLDQYRTAAKQLMQPGVAAKLRAAQTAIPIVGPTLNRAGSQLEQGDIAGAIGSTAAVVPQVLPVAEAVSPGATATAATNAANALGAAADTAKVIPATVRNVLIGPKMEDIPATDAFIKSTVPRNSIKNIREIIDRGLPDARRAADSMGMDLDNMTLQDAEKAVVQAKNDVWGEFENQHLKPNETLQVDTNPVADRIGKIEAGMTDIQKRRLGLVDDEGNQNPNHPITKAIADYEGQALPLRDINTRIQELNNQLRSQQAQFKVNEMALRRDPKYAPLYAELDGLRQLETDTLNQVSGPGAKDLKQRYGALKVMEDVISRRIPVAERKAPVGVFQGLGRIAGLGNTVAGTWQTVTGHPQEGIPNIAKGAVQLRAGANAQELNDPHALMQQAFKATEPRPEAEQ